MQRISRIQIPQGTMFFQETGYTEHKPVVFLHGNWEDSHQWAYVMKLIGKHFHCLAPDLLGVGGSQTNYAPSSIDLQVEALYAWITSLKLGAVHIVGHSVGAWVAVSFALRYPELVEGAILISTEGLSLEGWHREYSKFDRWLLRHPFWFKIWSRALKTISPSLDEESQLAKTIAKWHKLQLFPVTTQLFLSRSESSIKSELITDKIRWLRTPIRVLQGQLEDGTTIDQSKYLAETAPASEFHWLNDDLDLPPHKLSRQVAKQIYIFVMRVERSIDNELSHLW
jgi:pimeloyl-ACP methyl ester carboxylesterase